ncbi:WcaF family extracellular polysaccharide biosynthesis acetyltransferase [Pedobacter sp. JY14-1]|uniref:WcaF family extracellular polysaccharide biosynthesis acetyltransferase n=1 Tax=Pedobacter sp. JY14-1 TaxID=3034151 RepID=UPI0023E30C6B|nr:WcaF family extracellular polysaccharide biosynthesis acetyltransferase [Pedobacter sp. JY14-1]
MIDIAYKSATYRSRVELKDFDAKVGLDRGASRLKESLWYIVKMFFFLSAFPFPSSFKAMLLRRFGAKVGKGVVIKPRVNIHMPWKLVVGHHSWLGEEVFLLNFEPLTIGDNVCVSQRVFLCCGNHNFRDPAMSYRNGPIVLGDGSWIGVGCFIGPGVRIGMDTVVCAASVVTRSLESNGVYKGNPAVFVKPRWQ